MHDKLMKQCDPSSFKAFHCGIERESLRITPNGTLSRKPHPEPLGSSLTHPYISTDFSEQQMEWNTPPCPTFQKAVDWMKALLHFSLEKMEEELFWPYSMPPFLDHIDIADFGSSHQGRKKKIYRMGLQDRYGAKLQMISGIHVNFSFNKSFWEKRHALERSSLSLKAFINANYMAIIRNFLREGWFLTYLFGACPAIEPHYVSSLPKGFMAQKDFYYAPYGTSIRNSTLGYYSRIQNQLAISFNGLDAYLSDMKKALSTEKKEYRSIASQLNPCLLQTPNEHYSRIRPKVTLLKGENFIEALEKRGIEYVEIRSIDVSPSDPLGLSIEQLECIHLFLLYCLLKKSPPLSLEEQQCLTDNQNKVALKGRDPTACLRCPDPVPLRMWATKIMKQLKPLASFLGYETTWAIQEAKIQHPERCPSSFLLDSFLKKGFRNQLLLWSQSHKQSLTKSPLAEKKRAALERFAVTSHLDTKRLETASKVLVEGYETLELSTQVLIREALKRDVRVTSLDDTDHIFRLERRGQIEHVKEATKTSKDSYIAFHLLQNKHVTKTLLSENGLFVPWGKRYSALDEAVADYSEFQKKKIVVKPNDTNFGMGIHFVEPGDKKGYAFAIQNALAMGPIILVEEYFPGEEFRFLVIDGKVIAIAKREPAHVVGDGRQSIQALVRAKNCDPFYYRDPKHYIRLGKEEREMLKKQRLNLKSIPKKGTKIALRRNSNVSTGGDPIDVTDIVEKGYQTIAIQATATLNAKICGVDMLICNPHVPPNCNNYRIIELNYNPVLFIHAHPYKGQPRDVAGPLLDLLGYSEESGAK